MVELILIINRRVHLVNAKFAKNTFSFLRISANRPVNEI